MIKYLIILISTAFSISSFSQDLSEGLIVNDLSLHPMQVINKPDYLETIIDPSFGTTIRRISNAGSGGVIVPMYSTVQAWNADESLMILYNQSNGTHDLINGMTYEFIETLNGIQPADLEQLFWDFNDPDTFYFLEANSHDFIKYSVENQTKETLVNLEALSGCENGISMGNDIQMMSWNSDVFSFRCGNETGYSYRFSTEELTTFSISEINFAAPGVAPSGERYYHESSVYNSLGESIVDLNISSVEHSCLGRLSNGNDAYFAIAFAEGPDGGCIGDIIAHDLESGVCFPLISQEQGYNYPQSGTHISALAHKNTEGGWLAASMMGYDLDGQALLDQELVIAKADQNGVQVCRIGHHRSDESQFDYWGEPHAVISPTGTRVLFGSDWSGSEDGQSVDSYVVELPSFVNSSLISDFNSKNIRYQLYPNPTEKIIKVEFSQSPSSLSEFRIYNINGTQVYNHYIFGADNEFDIQHLSPGMYYFCIMESGIIKSRTKFTKH
jgi:hypothetical protein